LVGHLPDEPALEDSPLLSFLPRLEQYLHG